MLMQFRGGYVTDNGMEGDAWSSEADDEKERKHVYMSACVCVSAPRIFV